MAKYKNGNRCVRLTFNKRLLPAAVVGLLIVIADYFVQNMTYPVFDASESLALHGLFFDHDPGQEADDEIFAVNVAHDRQLVPLTDMFGRPDGNAAITDRSRLLQFLDIASRADYRYIFLDVRFEEGMVTESDSALFDLLGRMPRTVFSTHRSDGTYVLSADAPACKSAYADFRCMRMSGFSRYEYLQDASESVALRMYRELDGGTIEPRGPVYTDGHGHLCYNTLFVPVPARMMESEGIDGEVRFPYMGPQLLDMYTPLELRDMMSGKIVIIGDFDNDRHTTFTGSAPGPLISYMAYRALRDGRHRVSYPLYIVLWILFTSIIYALLSSDDSRMRRPMRVGGFVISLIGWGALLWALKVILYWVFVMSFSPVIPAFVFTLIQLYRNNFKR